MNLLQPHSDEDYMRLAMRESAKAGKLGEVPVGAIIVAPEGQVIARAHNQVETLKDATAHAEMLVLSVAQAAIGDWRLDGHTVYVTKEPCAMCAGALVHCRPSRVVIGCPDPKSGAAGGWINLLDSNPPLNHRCEVSTNVLGAECLHELQHFFRTAREQSSLRRAARAAKLARIDHHSP